MHIVLHKLFSVICCDTKVPIKHISEVKLMLSFIS